MDHQLTPKQKKKLEELFKKKRKDKGKRFDPKQYGKPPKGLLDKLRKKKKDGVIDFKELENQLGLEVITVSTIMQKPGNIIPWHRDIFYQITKKFPNRKEEKVRANMFLTDWENGQFLQFDDEVITNWKKNTGYIFNDQVLHLSSNAGLKNKVTLQVSGFY